MEISHGSMKVFMKEDISVKRNHMRVSADSVEAVRVFLEEYGFTVAQLARRNSIHAGRKTVRADDILLAIEQLG